MPNPKFLLIAVVALVLVGEAHADAEQDSLRLQKVLPHVYALVGPLGNRNAKNLGNNATFGVVVTDEGVVLIDSGGSFRGAAAIANRIKQVTDKPVKIVINTGGQDHRWLGNGYFKARGARIIASAAAVADQRERTQDQLFMLGNLLSAKALEGTEPVYATETFVEDFDFSFGGIQFKAIRVGPAHTPGDSIVWLPNEKLAFAGDVVYVERILGVNAYSNSRHWLTAFESIAALKPKHVVPGHGAATDLARATADTYDYLVFLRKAVTDFMEQGGDISRSGTLNQSQFKYLKNYDTLKGRNAQQVYQELEWE